MNLSLNWSVQVAFSTFCIFSKCCISPILNPLFPLSFSLFEHRWCLRPVRRINNADCCVIALIFLLRLKYLIFCFGLKAAQMFFQLETTNTARWCCIAVAWLSQTVCQESSLSLIYYSKSEEEKSVPALKAEKMRKDDWAKRPPDPGEGTGLQLNFLVI